jgi:hypothetical protein
MKIRLDRTVITEDNRMTLPLVTQPANIPFSLRDRGVVYDPSRDDMAFAEAHKKRGYPTECIRHKLRKRDVDVEFVIWERDDRLYATYGAAHD